MRLIKTLWTAAVVAATAAVAVVAGPAPAHAFSQYRCNYPYVCIYGGTDIDVAPIVGRYRDVTPGWQYQSGTRRNFGVVNTRNDDTVYILYRNPGESVDHVLCLLPNDNVAFIFDESFRGIRIDSSQYCSLSS